MSSRHDLRPQQILAAKAIDCPEWLELSLTREEQNPGAARHLFSRLLNGGSGMSPEMAIRSENTG